MRTSAIMARAAGEFATDIRNGLTKSGGGTLVFDEYGRIKYHVAQRLRNSASNR